MTSRATTITGIRAGRPMDTVRLRYIATQAENFTKMLDDLHNHLATVATAEERMNIAIVEQAAAAAADLAITAAIAADTITRVTET